ncbi:DUF1289 domain-containing protein [Herminiimonas sp. CN]|uniref:DUF1289 domain-containing protein n=1 Tax=Herminiimonas sp. CN TaxID=1349818 RepID=UPI000474123D|nr:DUF1289 domain-containing protein [Herminiimonas sp. CN]
MQNFDPETHIGPVPSPCINVCQMDQASGLCQGCRRTIAEIVAWSQAGESEKRAIWRKIQRRTIPYPCYPRDHNP